MFSDSSSGAGQNVRGGKGAQAPSGTVEGALPW